MQNITFSINSDAVRAGVEQRTQMRARGDFEAMRVRAARGVCGGCDAPTCTAVHGIAPMPHISFPGFVRACTTTATTAVATVATTAATMATNAVRGAQAQVPEEEPMADQYAVGNAATPKRGLARFFELIHGVAISNDIAGRPGRISTLLGPTGHYERLSFWTHVAGALLFIGYAIFRQASAGNNGSIEGGLTTASGWTIAAVFLTSSVYHGTAPDPGFSFVTRVLDYVAIYVGITVSTTADIAVATRGFQNVPVETVLDLPLAAGIIIAFFVWRRWLTPLDETWEDHQHRVNAKKRPDCSLCIGLFSRGHCDGAHAHSRQATSLLIFANFFMSAPTAFALLGGNVASVVLTLQIFGFVLVVFGMAVDRVFEWPDAHLIEEDETCFACPQSCGGALNSHALWHIIATLSAACTVASREFALANY